MDKTNQPLHYVNNTDLYKAMVVYRKAAAAAKKTNQTRPAVPDYVGECILKIATHLAYRPNFSAYTFRDEMVCDGIENCLQYIDNFNPRKSKNPFAYFTQIIYFAFVRRIQKERRHLYIKYKAIEHANLEDHTAGYQDSDGDGAHAHPAEVLQSDWTKEQMRQFMADFEEARERKRQPKRLKRKRRRDKGKDK